MENIKKNIIDLYYNEELNNLSNQDEFNNVAYNFVCLNKINNLENLSFIFFNDIEKYGGKEKDLIDINLLLNTIKDMFYGTPLRILEKENEITLKDKILSKKNKEKIKPDKHIHYELFFEKKFL
jgi:hypothetical protein